MKLTIGMIVKNEEKYLERCITAIKPILENVDSELVITDTGSTDRTVEIAKKYTNNILHFDWCDDFSAARNTVFPVAKGEWIMVLDPDDIFESCDGIIDFFNSGEYKKYNSATYISKNVAADRVSSYSFNAQRLTRVFPNTRYVGIVHEVLNTFGKPIKNLPDTADHYGYCYENETDKKRKFDRNSKLLLKRLREESPINPMLYIQLFETYMIMEYKHEANEYMEKGIEYCKSGFKPVLAALYCRKAYNAVLEERYADAVEICDIYMKECSRLTTDKEILAIRAAAAYRLNEYEEAFTSLKDFFIAYRDVKNGVLNTDDGEIINYLASSEDNYIAYVCVFLVCCLNLDRCNTVIDYISFLEIKEHIFDKESADSLVPLEVKVLERIGLGNLDSFLNNLDEYGKQKLMQAVGKLKTKKEQSIEMNQLSTMLKMNIKNMINNGNYDNAKKFIDEYEKINPSDPEISKIRTLMK